MYIIAAIVWIILIFLLEFWKSGYFGWVFLLLPLFVYGVNMSNIKDHTVDIEDDMLQGNFLSLVYLFVLFIINWVVSIHL